MILLLKISALQNTSTSFICKYFNVMYRNFDVERNWSKEFEKRNNQELDSNQSLEDHGDKQEICSVK